MDPVFIARQLAATPAIDLTKQKSEFFDERDREVDWLSSPEISLLESALERRDGKRAIGVLVDGCTEELLPKLSMVVASAMEADMSIIVITSDKASRFGQLGFRVEHLPNAAPHEETQYLEHLKSLWGIEAVIDLK